MKKLIFLVGLALASVMANAAGNLICRLAPGVWPYTIGQAYRLTLLDYTPGSPFAYYAIPGTRTVTTVRAEMVGDAKVAWAEDDATIEVPETEGAKKQTLKGSTLPAVGDRLAVTNLNSDALGGIKWSSSLAWAPGRAVRVAVLDTGITPYTPYLRSKVVSWLNTVEPGELPWDIPRHQDSNRDGRFDSKTGHGTMVAGIIDQVSPLSRLVVVRVADSDGRATAWRVIKGLAFAVRSGAVVANISLGAPNRIIALSDVINWCTDNGLVIVAAAGNNGTKSESFPARFTAVIGVGGLNPNNSKAGFSNYGGGLVVSGPAVAIVSQDWDGSLSSWSGTSFSTPLATGLAAEAMRRSVVAPSPSDMRNAFRNFGDDLDAVNPAYRSLLGKGLNFMKFVAAFPLAKAAP